MKTSMGLSVLSRARRPRRSLWAVVVAAGIALTSWIGEPSAEGASPVRVFEPVRREARIEVGVRNNTDSLPPEMRDTLLTAFRVTDPRELDYFAADFVLPRATTAELAAFARRASKADAVRWFCQSYATSPDFDPASPSLRGLLVAAAVEGGSRGERAGDALVCPEVDSPRRRGVSPRLSDSIGDALVRFFVGFLSRAFGFLSDAVGIEGTGIATAQCVATDEMRGAFDVAACSELLLPRRHARRILACRPDRRAPRRVPPSAWWRALEPWRQPHITREPCRDDVVSVMAE